MSEGIIQIIIAFLSGSGLTIAFITYVFKHPEKVENWSVLIFGVLSKVWKGANYLETKYDIQSKINTFVNRINSDSTTQFPKISIQWAGKEGEDIIWEEGKAILIIRDQKHKIKNFVYASHFFVTETLLKKAKRHLSKNQKLALDLFATKKVLEDQSPAALEYFMTDYFVPNLDKEEKIREFVRQFISIDRMGVFFPVLIQEMIYLGHKFFLDKPNAVIIAEVNQLIDFLQQFAERKVGDDTIPHSFRGNYMRSCIRVVARQKTREKGNVTGHKTNICEAVTDGFANIYVIGRSDDGNKTFIRDVVKAVLEEHSHVQQIKNY